MLPFLTIPDGKIRDYIDGKLRNDTPEEYVRQTIERRLGYNLADFKIRVKSNIFIASKVKHSERSSASSKISKSPRHS